MSAIIVRQKNEYEPDLFTGNEFSTVVVTDINAGHLASLKAPEDGWTIEKLEALEPFLNSIYGEWEAILGCVWIGSSEV